jgi:hypothetical protein
LAFVALVVLTLGFGKVMGSPPKTAAPWGIVSLAFAGSLFASFALNLNRDGFAIIGSHFHF